MTFTIPFWVFWGVPLIIYLIGVGFTFAAGFFVTAMNGREGSLLKLIGYSLIWPVFLPMYFYFRNVK